MTEFDDEFEILDDEDVFAREDELLPVNKQKNADARQKLERLRDELRLKRELEDYFDY